MALRTTPLRDASSSATEAARNFRFPGEIASLDLCHIHIEVA